MHQTIESDDNVIILYTNESGSVSVDIRDQKRNRHVIDVGNKLRIRTDIESVILPQRTLSKLGDKEEE